MSIAEILHTLILGPLELLFDYIFSLSYDQIGNAGLCLIILSLIVNLLILPLYRRADAIQDEEREQAARMKPWVDHIKKAFRGDEQYLILQTYYRQNDYKPLYALRSALPLLLQVPFFIAAYNYLSHLAVLQGVSFGPIPDLGRPDGMLRLGGWTVNVLPVAMTLINVVSGAVYTRGLPLKSRIQVYGTALVFLVLLYNSPAGLVFYWTLNNVFSLGKNLLKKTPDPRKTGRILWAVSGAAFLAYFEVIRPVAGPRMKALFALAGLLMMLPLARSFLPKKEKAPADEKAAGRIFLAAAVFLAILTGLLIPSALIGDSPQEFIDTEHFIPPILYVLKSALMAAGLFLVWGGVYYKLSSPRTRSSFSIGFICAAAAAMTNYTLFGLQYGSMSSLVVYDYIIKVHLKDMLINGGAILLGCAVIFLLWKKWRPFLQIVAFSGCAAILCMSVINISNIVSETAEVQKREEQKTAQAADGGELPYFTLDRQGRNVVFIMLDRSISGFVPYIFNEKPELAEKYDGFVYYPNALSYGAYTNSGSPACYGGYEYTPLEINARTDQTMQEKHNEALLLMPVVFKNEGYEATACDSPFGNYQWISDMSIYDEYGISAYRTYGAFTDEDPVKQKNTERLRWRNMFCYSLFRVSPVLLHWEMYDKGQYNDAAVKWADQAVVYLTEDEERSHGIKNDFLGWYSVLDKFSSMTRISDDGSNHFMMIRNETTHDVQMVQMPDYVPRSAVDNSAFDNSTVKTSADGKKLKLGSVMQAEHYHSNMAALLRLSGWLDYLRENGLYDNTRIIIASDHGRSIGLYSYIMDGVAKGSDPDTDKMPDVMSFNPLLMVKDFGSHGFRTDNTFMTNADVPVIAFRDLIAHPVNPFTGNEITDAMKANNEQYPIHTDFRLTGKKSVGFKNFRKIVMRNHYMFDPANWAYEQ